MITTRSSLPWNCVAATAIKPLYEAKIEWHAHITVVHRRVHYKPGNSTVNKWFQCYGLHVSPRRGRTCTTMNKLHGKRCYPCPATNKLIIRKWPMHLFFGKAGGCVKFQTMVLICPLSQALTPTVLMLAGSVLTPLLEWRDQGSRRSSWAKG